MINKKNYLVTILTLMYLIHSVNSRCFTSLNLKDSAQECSFNYEAIDKYCEEYHFTNCSYFYNTTTYWIFGLVIDSIHKNYVQESSLQRCSETCCKRNMILLDTFDGFRQCQKVKFQEQALQKSLFEKGFDILILGLVLWIIGHFIVCVITAMVMYVNSHGVRLQDDLAVEPRQLQMRLM